MKMTPQQYCLRWKHHHSNVQSMFAQLLEKERFCDVTLYCSPSFATQVPEKGVVEAKHIRGVSLRAHRVVLAACSELLGTLLGAHESQGEPVLVIDGAEPRHLRALLDYMYTGEMSVHRSQLASLLKTAEELRIKGLSDIRWNNKDEPPDCQTDSITTTTTNDQNQTEPIPEVEDADVPNIDTNKQLKIENKPLTPERNSKTPEPERTVPRETESKPEKFSVNGGPPPLIKLPSKEKSSPMKRENSDSESPSPKRQRIPSSTDHTDDEAPYHVKSEREDWQHGNLDITAERVVNWGGAQEDESREHSEDEWADNPADIGSFLHTNLQVYEENSNDEESNDGAPPSTSTTSSGGLAADIKQEPLSKIFSKPTIGPKSGPTDPRFTDVVKLNDYLRQGRRPQFWEESYVRRVMEAVRLKELEMKQAAEILGVSYGTLYGRYRDVYGCINRPYRSGREFWQAKGPSEILSRLQSGELTMDSAATALGVTIANLVAHLADFCVTPSKEYEPPVEQDSLYKAKSLAIAAAAGLRTKALAQGKKPLSYADKGKKVMVGSVKDEDSIPATVITTELKKPPSSAASATTSAVNSGKWPLIRLASIESLRAEDTPPCLPPGPAPSPGPAPASPSQLMRTRPDLTIVAAKKPDQDGRTET